MRVTADEMWEAGHCPLDVFDANGTLVRGRITAFDAETGQVWRLSSSATDFLHIYEETYPAPLTWRKLT
jgi:hypothetical protein